MGCKGLEPMGNWVKGEGQECRPCRVAVGVGRYRKTLTEAGQGNLADMVSAALEQEEDTLIKVAATMDEVKALAPPEVKAVLESLDCELQGQEECGLCQDEPTG